MAEFLYASAHLAGDFENPTNAVGNTPGTWAGVLNNNQNRTSRWAIADPANPLTGSATQTIRVVARKGTNSNDPTVALNLYENGALVQSILADTSVTSTSGQTLTGTFNTSAVSNGADVEIEVVMTASGGSPSARNSAQISHIEWEADTSAAAVEGTGSASISVTTTAAGTRTAQGTAAASIAVATTATGQRTAVGSGSATVTVTATGSGTIPSGAVEGTGAATVSVSATASGTRIAKGTGTAGIVASTAATGQRTAKGQGTTSVTVAASATGQRTAKGQGSASVAVALTAVGHRTAKGQGSATVTVSTFGASGDGSDEGLLLLLGVG